MISAERKAYLRENVGEATTPREVRFVNNYKLSLLDDLQEALVRYRVEEGQRYAKTQASREKNGYAPKQQDHPLERLGARIVERLGKPWDPAVLLRNEQYAEKCLRSFSSVRDVEVREEAGCYVAEVRLEVGSVVGGRQQTRAFALVSGMLALGQLVLRTRVEEARRTAHKENLMDHLAKKAEEKLQQKLEGDDEGGFLI